MSPTVLDINLVSHSTQSSNEDGESPLRKISGEPKGVQMRTEGFVIPPETLDLSDTGTSFTLQIDSTLSRNMPTNESPSLHPLQLSRTSNEEGDGHITLASSPLQVNKSPCTARLPQLAEETGKCSNSKSNANSKESEFPKSKNLANETTLFEFIMFILFYFVKLYYDGMANFEFIMLYFVKFTKDFFLMNYSGFVGTWYWIFVHYVRFYEIYYIKC